MWDTTCLAFRTFAGNKKVSVSNSNGKQAVTVVSPAIQQNLFTEINSLGVKPSVHSTKADGISRSGIRKAKDDLKFISTKYSTYCKESAKKAV